MKRSIFPILLTSGLIFCLFEACSEKDEYSINNYFNTKQQDTLLTNIVTYVYKLAPEAKLDTRFEPRFRTYYQKAALSFVIANYYIAPDSTHYFMLIRPVGAHPTFRRGVVGKFKLKGLMPTEFEEIANTPHLEEAVVRERAGFLFKALIKEKNINNYLSMKHYVEWPDSTLIYDKKKNTWVSTGKF
ncbi:MAG: hypothetical protein U0X91_28585 [Spirosomataceae bacterium]